MKERMQKTLAEVKGCPQKDRTESEGYVGAQTFMWICEDNIVEVPFDKEHLLDRIISPDNLLKAYKAVQRSRGCSGIDKMSCEQMPPWLLANKDALIRSLLDGSYRPNPVKRVEIPKDNGKMRLLGIPTVIDRLVQQAINQTLTPIYERQFSPGSYGFRPRRGCHDALRGAQKIIDDGYIYVVDLDLERFFDTVSHSRLIEILSRTIKDGRVISLIHKYLRSGVMNKRRTSEIGKAKYLLFAPLAGALLMVSNIESVAREIGEQIPEVAEVQQKAEQALNADVVVANPTAEEAKAAAEAKKAEEAKAAELAKSEAEQKAEAKASDATAPADTTKNVVYDVTETMPQFPGGQGVMMKYLAANIKYPASAVKANKQGRVIVTFVIQKDGSVTEARIARSVEPELDAEALRIVKAMPNWTPGTQDGKPVNVKYTIPVVFSLQKDVTPGKKEVK